MEKLFNCIRFTDAGFHCLPKIGDQIQHHLQTQ